MNKKHISTQSNKILTHFNKLEQDCFVYAEAVNTLPNSSNSALKELLSDMAKRGLLMRLKKGLFNKFSEILRDNNILGNSNAFNKILSLFL